jgi:hypothetical protein
MDEQTDPEAVQRVAAAARCEWLDEQECDRPVADAVGGHTYCRFHLDRLMGKRVEFAA